MSAKHKLNGAHVLGALMVAGLVGGTSQSWTVFVVALIGLLVVGFIARDLRL